MTADAAQQPEPGPAQRPTLLVPVTLRELIEDERERLAEVRETDAADLQALVPGDQDQAGDLLLGDGPGEVPDLVSAAVQRALASAPSPLDLPPDVRARLRTLLAGPAPRRS